MIRTLILIALLLSITNNSIMAQEKITQTAGRQILGEFAPKFAELNDNVLFGDDGVHKVHLGRADPNKKPGLDAL